MDDITNESQEVNSFPAGGHKASKLFLQHLGALEKIYNVHEPRHEIFSNVVYATRKGSDQAVHTHSLFRAFACRLKFYDW